MPQSTWTLDALGRVTGYVEQGGFDGSFQRSNIVYDRANRELSETNVTMRRDTAGASSFTYYTTNLTNTYSGGLLVQQLQDTYKGSSGVLNSTTDNAINDSRQVYGYTWWNGAMQGTIGNDQDNSGGTPEWTTAYHYDASGHVTDAHIIDGRTRDVYYKTDQNGMIVDRDEADALSGGDPRQIRYFYAGLQLGQTGNDGSDNLQYTASIADRLAPASTSGGAFRGGTTTSNPYWDFEQSYDAINGSSPGTATNYTATGGETLAMVAQNVWGDASLWYLIADANGLTGADTLASGQVLTIPNTVRNIHNTADTFRPYDPNQALGDNSPTDAKPPKKNKCGIFGQILQTIVTVAVAIVLTPEIGIVGAAMVGNAAGQLFGMATGIQQGGFNFKSFAMAGVTAMVTAGVGSVLGQGAMLGSQIVGDVVRGVAANVITQGIGVATHLQDKFSWMGVATAGISAGVGGLVSRHIGGANGGFVGKDWVAKAAPSFGNNLISGMAGGIAAATFQSVATGTDFGDNLLAVLPDVIGQTLGR